MRSSPQLRLADLLRRERELDPAEVYAVLRNLPALLDDTPAWTDDPAPLLSRIALLCRPSSDRGAAKVFDEPIAQWPPIQTSWVSEDEEPGVHDVTLSIEKTIQAVPRTRLDGPGRLAVLIYELLGGVADERGQPRFSPLPPLNEAANAVLRQAVAGGAFPNSSAFWDAWVKELKSEQRRLPAGMIAWRVPDYCVQDGTVSNRLDLELQTGSGPGIRIVARDRFRIGRSRSLSDLALRIWEHGAFSSERTNEISRIHVTWDSVTGGFLDGHGSRPSANGASYAGSRLSKSSPVPLVDFGRLIVGPRYALRVINLPRTGPWPWRVVGDSQGTEADATTDVSGLESRVLCFTLPADQPIFREALWMRREVGFTIVGDGRPRWSTDPCTSAAWVVHLDGRFFLANHHFAPGTLEIDGRPLVPEQIVPLASGQVLRIGGVPWTVQMPKGLDR